MNRYRHRNYFCYHWNRLIKLLCSFCSVMWFIACVAADRHSTYELSSRRDLNAAVELQATTQQMSSKESESTQILQRRKDKMQRDLTTSSQNLDNFEAEIGGESRPWIIHRWQTVIANASYPDANSNLKSNIVEGMKLEQTHKNHKHVSSASWDDRSFTIFQGQDRDHTHTIPMNDQMYDDRAKVSDRNALLKNHLTKGGFEFEETAKYWNKPLQSKKKGRYPGMHTVGYGNTNDVTHQELLYTNWSRWSRCSRHCQQIRRRRCRVQDFCGATVIKEKRPCAGWRCHHKSFHLIKPEEMSSAYDSLNPKGSLSNIEARALLNYNSMFYTKWTEWTPCSGTCLTTRYRSCLYFPFCGNTVIKEEGYCYTSHSACEKWYRRHKTGYTHENNDRLLVSNKELIDHRSKFMKENFLVPSNKIEPSHRFGSRNFAITSTSMNNGVFLESYNPAPSKNYKYEANVEDSDSKFHGKNGISVTNGFGNVNKSYSLKKTSFLTNHLPFHSKGSPLSSNIAGKAAPPSHRTFSSQYLSKPNYRQQECGVSFIPKPSWDLKIIGGRESPPGKWPWQVAVLNKFKELICGGTLITSLWVVTAAHCIRKRLYVRLAEHDLVLKEGTEMEFKITETVLHPLYDLTTVDNDVALLRLPHPVASGSKISPACMPEQGAPLPSGMECTIIGWGKERNARSFRMDVLNEAEVPIINEEVCRRVYNDYYITQNMFCAGYLRGRIDSCAGDSGGPLLCNTNGLWYIYGITSFGEGCGKKGKFGIYTKLSNYRIWINDVIKAHAHRKQSKQGIGYEQRKKAVKQQYML